jgi:thiamine pyrophosphate-dependent acetolactate synthase large subunit-like protein
MRVGEAVVDALAALETEVAFGIPGVHTIELYRGLARSRVRPVTARHEQGAGFMADGYARVTGRPGVCVLISGPGVTNALTPIAQAYHDSVPLFVLASTTDREQLRRGRGPLHDLPDQAALLRGVTSFSETVTDPAALEASLRCAWVTMLSGRPRPVHLALPNDLLGVECEPLRAGASVPAPPEPDREAVGRAAALLAGARSPIILLGGGAVDAGDAAAELAERRDAPVVLTGNAKGAVPSSHPLCVGALLPFRPVQDLIASADVALVVGTELSEVDVIYSGESLRFGGAVVRADVDPAQLDAGVPSTVALQGDARAVLSALTDALRERGDAPRGAVAGTARVRDAIETVAWTEQSRTHIPWLDALERALPDDRILALDSAQLAYTAHHYLPAERTRSWLAPYGYGTLGSALPMAVGAKLGCPDRPVAAIAGDGGLLFTIAELATAVELRLPIPIVVWDNRGYGEIRDSFDRAEAPRVGTETTALDLRTIARGFGCATAEPASPDELEATLTGALEVNRPTLIRIAAGG